MNFVSALVAAMLASAVICLSGSACPCEDVKELAAKPINTSENVLDGLRWTHTAEYTKEFNEAIKQARAACLKHIGKPYVAIVADVDETVLDNRPHMEQNPVIGWKGFEPWVQQAKAPALKPTTELLAWARKNGYAVFLVTGRYESTRKATIENLVSSGIAYDGLFMRQDGNHVPAEEFKSAYRKAIEDMGFRIVLNIGDQVSDLLGGYSEECIKLPNKMYFIN